MAVDPRTGRAIARAAGAPAAGAAAAPAPAAAPTIQQVHVSMMDTFIPVIPEVSAESLAARFKTSSLTKIEGPPTHADMNDIRDELYRNCLAVKSFLGGGKHGLMGMIMADDLYLNEAGVAFVVPVSEGSYPNFPAGADEDAKKRETALFIKREKAIKTVDVMKELLRNLILEAVDPAYYAELEHRIYKYDHIEPRDILSHLVKNYAKIDDQMIEANYLAFTEAPDLTEPIDVYFRKQEHCQLLASDGGVPISDANLVMQLQLHIGKTGTVNTAYTKWKQKPMADRSWTIAKTFFRKALGDAEEINKLTTGEAGLTANSVVKKREATEEKVREEMQEQLGEAFDSLAMAATAKNETIDNLVASVAALTATNAKQNTQIIKLTDDLKKALAANNNNSTWRGGRPNTNPTNPTNPTRNRDEWADPKGYCWTCGYKVDYKHNGKTCKTCAPGHKAEATRQNTMGGSTRNAGFGEAPNGK